MDSLAGRTLLVTGGARGMGRLYALRAADERAAAVAIWDADAKALEATAAELFAEGITVHPRVVDLAQPEAIAEAAAELAALFGASGGAPDVLINNAGIVRGKLFWEHDERDIELTMAVNALAPMRVTRAFLPAMLADRARERRIVNISSAAGLVANPRMSVYCASKWACTGWSDSLRLELQQAGHAHVKVTTVCPSYVSTGMFDGARPMLMTPILAPEAVVERVWRAMKRGRPRLILPWSVHLSNALKGLLPVRAYDWLAEHVFGIYRSMEGFRAERL